MDADQLRHEAIVAAATMAKDGCTAAGKHLADQLVATSNAADLSYGENAFAAAWLLSTFLGSLSLHEQAVMLTGVGNLAIEMFHRQALAEIPPAGQA